MVSLGQGSVNSAELFRCRATCALAMALESICRPCLAQKGATKRLFSQAANLAACAVADACRGVEMGDARS